MLSSICTLIAGISHMMILIIMMLEDKSRHGKKKGRFKRQYFTGFLQEEG